MLEGNQDAIGVTRAHVATEKRTTGRTTRKEAEGEDRRDSSAENRELGT